MTSGTISLTKPKPKQMDVFLPQTIKMATFPNLLSHDGVQTYSPTDQRHVQTHNANHCHDDDQDNAPMAGNCYNGDGDGGGSGETVGEGSGGNGNAGIKVVCKRAEMLKASDACGE